MRENDIASERIPDAAQWEKWMLMLSEGMLEMLQMTAASVLAGLGSRGKATEYRPVPVSTVLTERIVSGMHTVLPEGDDFSAGREDTAASTGYGFRKHRKSSGNPGGSTPYETVRELQKQSELLLRT